MKTETMFAIAAIVGIASISFGAGMYVGQDFASPDCPVICPYINHTCPVEQTGSSWSWDYQLPEEVENKVYGGE